MAKYFQSDGLPAAEGLAIDEMLAHTVAADPEHAPCLHLYTFQPAIIVGHYQDIHAVVKFDRCKELGVAYNRRHTGGGTVIMDENVLALGLAVSMEHPRLQVSRMETVIRLLGNGVIAALQELGIEAAFRPKNDVHVKGRKIAGLAASREQAPVVLFHASVLVDFDIERMLQIMHIPLEKIADKPVPKTDYPKGYGCFSQRMTTANAELSQPITVDLLRERTRASFAALLDEEFVPAQFSAQQRAKVAQLRQERYDNPAWIFSKRHPQARMSYALKKTPGGLLQIYLSLLGETIEYVLITGDFFTDFAMINQLETALKYAPAEPAALTRIISEHWSEDAIVRVTVADLVATIMQAKENYQKEVCSPSPSNVGEDHARKPGIH